MDLVRYISTFIPREIEVNGQEYTFRMFINHPHYDFRFCYKNENAEHSFLFLYENIDSESSLMECLVDLHSRLRKRDLLTGDYAELGGYDIVKHLAYMHGAPSDPGGGTPPDPIL